MNCWPRPSDELPVLAFSTNWNASRHHDGEAIVSEILAMGFETLELGHGLSVSQLHADPGSFCQRRFQCRQRP